MEHIAERLIEPVRIVIVVAIAYTLAQGVWFFVAGPKVTPVGDTSTARVGSAADGANGIDIILRRNLFGVAQQAAPAREPQAFDAPETRLRLTLEGVFRAEDPDASAAIVAEQGKPGKLYRVGETLPGNAELTEVYADRIVLRRGGQYETLRFEDTPNLIADAPDSYEAMPETLDDIDGRTDLPVDNRPLDQQHFDSVADAVAAYRERLDEDPEGTLESLGLSPVAKGAAQGYRLNDAANRPELARTGLQPGDVILSVNGEPVGDVGQDRAQIDKLMSEGSVRIEIQRGNRRFFVTTSLN